MKFKTLCTAICVTVVYGFVSLSVDGHSAGFTQDRSIMSITRVRSVVEVRPQYSEIVLDLVLHNPSSKSAWLILPQHISDEFPRGGVRPGQFTLPANDGAEVYCYLYSLSPRLVWYAGVSVNFQGLRMAPGATVKIDGVRFLDTSEVRHSAIGIEAILSQRLLVNSVDIGSEPSKSICSNPGEVGDIHIASPSNGRKVTLDDWFAVEGSGIALHVESSVYKGVSLFSDSGEVQSDVNKN